MVVFVAIEAGMDDWRGGRAIFGDVRGDAGGMPAGGRLRLAQVHVLGARPAADAAFNHHSNSRSMDSTACRVTPALSSGCRTYGRGG